MSKIVFSGLYLGLVCVVYFVGARGTEANDGCYHVPTTGLLYERHCSSCVGENEGGCPCLGSICDANATVKLCWNVERYEECGGSQDVGGDWPCAEIHTCAASPCAPNGYCPMSFDSTPEGSEHRVKLGAQCPPV